MKGAFHERGPVWAGLPGAKLEYISSIFGRFKTDGQYQYFEFGAAVERSHVASGVREF